MTVAELIRGADQKMAARDREGYTLLLGMRSWEFEAFAQLRRPDAHPGLQKLARP